MFMFISFSTHAWRETGHFAVCDIAYKNLTKTAKAKVDEIMQGENFVYNCIWPDLVRYSKQWRHTKTWHFLNLEDQHAKLDLNKPGIGYLNSNLLSEKGDILRGILLAQKVLQTKFDCKKAKGCKSQLDNLRFLAHLVADIHQPIHLGRKSDRGGNKAEVSWFGDRDHAYSNTFKAKLAKGQVCGDQITVRRKYKYKTYFHPLLKQLCVATATYSSKISLHKVWDLHFIDKLLADKGLGQEENASPYSYKEYAQYITKGLLVDTISKWQNSSIVDWAQESLGLRAQMYDFTRADLSGEYYRKNIEVINSRLAQAGYRLAATLNRLFDKTVRDHKQNQYLAEQEQKLSRAIRQMLDNPSK